MKYAHETDRRGEQEFVVEEGAVVRERQAIIRLPNADSMQVNLTINESLIQYVRPGLAAVISPVGLGDRVLRGTRAESQSICRADRLAAGERQGIQGVRQHRRSGARFALRHDGVGDDPLRQGAGCVASAGAGGVRARRQVLLLCPRRPKVGSTRDQARAQPTTSSLSWIVGLSEGDQGLDESSRRISRMSTCRKSRRKSPSGPCIRIRPGCWMRDGAKGRGCRSGRSGGRRRRAGPPGPPAASRRPAAVLVPLAQSRTEPQTASVTGEGAGG